MAFITLRRDQQRKINTSHFLESIRMRYVNLPVAEGAAFASRTFVQEQNTSAVAQAFSSCPAIDTVVVIFVAVIVVVTIAIIIIAIIAAAIDLVG